MKNVIHIAKTSLDEISKREKVMQIKSIMEDKPMENGQQSFACKVAVKMEVWSQQRT